ncbi:MAG: autotransporter domain-containing protein [Hyphomicrobiales bacterium]|nr:autotransporter domain-containing protein [Hyphomicrobiales bacterium]
MLAFAATRRAALSAVAVSALLAAAPAGAQQFSTLYAFGDSYVDQGNLLPPGTNPIYPTGRFSGGTNYIDYVSGYYGLPVYNFAIGGSQTGATNTVGAGIPGFLQQWMGFTLAGGRIAPTDLVALNIGGNDARAYYQSGGTLGGVGAASGVSAAQAMAGVNALVGAGMRNLVFTVGDVGALAEAGFYPSSMTSVGTAYSRAYNAQMQMGLAPLAAAGVRVEYVDIGLLGQQIKANPALYGVANPGMCPLSCVGNPALQSQYLFYVDGIHLTSLGFNIMGEYVVNRLNAPMTFAAQGDIGLTSTANFASRMFNRLDLFNPASSITPSQVMSYAPGAVRKGPLVDVPRAAPASPLAIFITVNGSLSERRASLNSYGYDLDSVGGTIGAEYRVAPNALIGVAFDYANASASFKTNGGRTEANVFQFGGYGAWNGRNAFVQGAASFGLVAYHNWRPGVVSLISSNPHGFTVSASAKAGYLFDVAPGLRVGPIAGLAYAHASVGSYAETGDPVLNLFLREQKAEALVGSFGAQMRHGLDLWGRRLNYYVNLTAENDFIGSGRIIQYGATSAPIIVNNWRLPNGGHGQLYGRAALGISSDIGYGASLSLNLSQTFLRRGGEEFTGSGGVKFAF